jgi:hypothetical protein
MAFDALERKNEKGEFKMKKTTGVFDQRLVVG